MAEFAAAFALTMKAEGGYVDDPQDPGGETYKGVARKYNSKWEGWALIDALKRDKAFPANLDGHAELQQRIREFYEVNFWDKVRGDDLSHQDVAESIFDFAVNAGCSASVKLAQLCVGADADGAMGSESVSRINAFDPRLFLALFALNKIARYITLCEKRPDSRKYFYGWVKRTLEAA